MSEGALRKYVYNMLHRVAPSTKHHNLTQLWCSSIQGDCWTTTKFVAPQRQHHCSQMHIHTPEDTAATMGDYNKRPTPNGIWAPVAANCLPPTMSCREEDRIHSQYMFGSAGMQCGVDSMHRHAPYQLYCKGNCMAHPHYTTATHRHNETGLLPKTCPTVTICLPSVPQLSAICPSNIL